MKTKIISFLKNNILSIIGFVVGLIGGFMYYIFVGCSSGSCPITSNPYVSSLYGGLVGWLVFNTFAKKK